MSGAQMIKIDRHAFSRGVDDLITFRPLRQVVSSVLGVEKASSKSSVVVKKDSESGSVFHDGKKQRPDLKK